MKTLLRWVCLGAFLFMGVATAAEVLVLTTATNMTPSPRSPRKKVAIQNLGPDAIFCQTGPSTGLAASKGWKLATDASVVFDAPATLGVWCITTTNQVTTGATVVLEL